LDKRSKEAFNDGILAEACRRFGITSDAVELLDGFESFIYFFQKGEKAYILRLSHSLRYSLEMIEGEIDWVNFLADHQVPAARGIPSERGRLAEKIEAEDGYFITSAFEKAPGRPPRREDWQTGLLSDVGRLIGKMHALAKDYEPSDPRMRRPEWDFEMDEFAQRYLPAGEEQVIERWDALLAKIRQLPKDRESYGLIHQDVHGGNFFVQDGKITLFDFGDCQYAWFAYDLAMALFYVLPHHCDSEEQRRFAREALETLAAGYRRDNAISAQWLEAIPLFLKLREIDLYIAIHRSMDLNNLDPWCATFMRGRKEKIEQNIPFVDILFSV